MSASFRNIGITVSFCALAQFTSGAIADGFDIEPYKLVRSLQRVQDQIANGDKSALGMQRELATLIDEGFNRLPPEGFGEPKTARALLSYAMAGGNPHTLEDHLTDLGKKDDEIVQLAVAVLVYQKGAGRTAEARLKYVDPRKVGGLFGASLALVRGLVTKDDEKARIDFDTARLLAPGTLVEEAALRRLMTIHQRRQDPVSFLRVASRYARRYVASPYAMQFAQEFVAGIVSMADWMDMQYAMDIVEFMPEPYRSAVTVRLMREATVAGDADLVERIAALSPAAKMKDQTADGVDPAIAARQDFYRRISEITSENVNEVALQLRALDKSKLSDGDRELLHAVLAIADAVTDPEPAVTAAIPAPPKLHPDSKFYSGRAKAPDNGISDFEAFVGGTRDTLDDIDKLLEDLK